MGVDLEAPNQAVYVTPGTTGLFQPLDVVSNAPFKTAMERLSNQNVQDNLEA